MNKRKCSPKNFLLAWWAGLFVLVFSMVMLALCTFLEIRNSSLIEIWKYAFFASVGYVVGHSLDIFVGKNSKWQQD